MRRFVVILAFFVAAAPAGAATLRFHNVRLPGTAKRVTEPRVIVSQDGRRWVVTNLSKPGGSADKDTFGDAVVFVSDDGGKTWQRTTANPPQESATIDTDVVAMHPIKPGGQPRILASELDSEGLNFPSGYTDDGGKTWTRTRGATELADQDRQWFAVGPDDPGTHQPTVYLLYHNLASGFVQHNMFVSKSTDGGATFGAPVPVALPGSNAYNDLQCADSGGPSDIAVNQRTGRVYAFFTTRGSPGPGGLDFGGCAAMPIEFNIVNATRVWVATSPDGSLGSWSDHLAVDDAKTGQVVSMQLAYGALDTAGNVYVAYPESPKPYPHLAGAAVKLVTQRSDGSKDLTDTFSKPATLVPAGGPGSLLVHLAVGDPGKLDVAYFKGKDVGAKDPVSGKAGPAWYLHVVHATNALATPRATDTRVSPVAAYTWTAENMMGLCSDPSDPTGGVQNGLACDRSTDVWGVALDSSCRLTVTWPVTKPHNSVSPDQAGTWVSTQTAGPALCHATPSCADHTAPSASIARLQVGRRRLRVTGTAHDRGCAGLRSVRVTVGRHVGGLRCRFFRGDGSFGRRRNCSRGQVLVAAGLRHWALTVRRRLPRGHYFVLARAVDGAHNKQPAGLRPRRHFRR